LELQVLDADDDSRVDGVGWTAGVEILIEFVGAEDRLAYLSNASGNLGGHVFVQVVRFSGRSDDCDDAKL